MLSFRDMLATNQLSSLFNFLAMMWIQSTQCSSLTTQASCFLLLPSNSLRPQRPDIYGAMLSAIMCNMGA